MARKGPTLEERKAEGQKADELWLVGSRLPEPFFDVRQEPNADRL
jgi:hypothetical protein